MPTIAEIDVAGVVAEDAEVTPEGAGVAVVEIDDRLVESIASASRRSKPAQRGWTKLVEPRALRTPALLAGPGVSSPTEIATSAIGNAGRPRGDRQAVGNLLQADVGPFDGSRRMLAQAVDQKAFLAEVVMSV